ncbi:MAG: triose-phosphate isomerase [Armatimonadetes bacterium]|nr:triose-phosphate isomerase [Armatimonadota bacterium]
MRSKLVAGNWKMHLSATEGVALANAVVSALGESADLDVVVCPPYLAIPAVKESVRNTPVKVGAQDVFWMEQGAFTGKVSAKMLSNLCIDYCIVGHSETRGRFGKLEVPASTVSHFAETDETVNLKIKALLYHAITPILCVGETQEERDAGKTVSVIQTQLEGALAGIDPAEMYGIVIAYEPVWAIGTGLTCASDEADRVCGLIRTRIAEAGSQDVADNIRILYGGSVKPDNARDLFSRPEIDGGLVGGASLEANGFSAIVAAAK